jgi:hypothetical protein
MGLLERWRKRLRRDDGTTEVIAYIFMFAVGSTALVFAMDVLTDAQRRGNDVAAAQQADQLGQLTGSLVEQAARVAQTAPNATYESTYQLPTPVGNNNMTVQVQRTLREGAEYSAADCDYAATVHVHSGDEQVSTSYKLGNVSTVRIDGECLRFEGELDTSAQAASVRYDPPTETDAEPTIVLEPTTR